MEVIWMLGLHSISIVLCEGLMLKNILPVTIFDTKLIVRNVALYMDPNFVV